MNARKIASRAESDLPRQDGGKASAVDDRGSPDAHQLAQRGENVVEINECVRLSLADARPGKDQRGLHAVFVQVLLAHQAVAAHCQAVIGRKNDDRVRGLARFFERLQDAADLLVEVGDHAVVISQMLADVRLGARPRGQPLVAPVIQPLSNGCSGR